MITNIYFVRHAHSTYTPEELTRPLSKEGLKAADKVRRLLSNENITHVISSPYKRAIQTVEGIVGVLGMKVITDDSFVERKLSDSSVDNFDETVFKAWEDFNYSLSGGESGFSAQQRGVQALENVLEKFSGGNIAIGTHGNIMVLIMNHYDKIYNYDFWTKLEMPDIYKMSFENKQLTEVKHIWEKQL